MFKQTFASKCAYLVTKYEILAMLCNEIKYGELFHFPHLDEFHRARGRELQMYRVFFPQNSSRPREKQPRRKPNADNQNERYDLTYRGGSRGEKPTVK